MAAMVLAAGYGRRLAPLTDHTPKPLLPVAGRALIDYHLDALAASRAARIVVNCAHLGTQVAVHVAARPPAGPEVRVVDEGPEPLETGGGIANALQLLGTEEFVVVNGDVFTDYPLARLLEGPLAPDIDAWLVLVPNPPHHPAGDFRLDKGMAAPARGAQGALTYAGIARFSRRLFADLAPTRRPLGPILEHAAAAGRVAGERYDGLWVDVGTPERLAEADRLARARE